MTLAQISVASSSEYSEGRPAGIQYTVFGEHWTEDIWAGFHFLYRRGTQLTISLVFGKIALDFPDASIARVNCH